MTFFALTIFNVMLLYLFYEIVAYGMATMIKCNRIFAIVYGFTIIILAVVAFILEEDDMDSIADKVWAALSTNQKEFFDGEVSKLKDTRSDNNLFVLMFSIVIGLCFICIGGLMFKLHALQAPEIVKQVTARIPVMQSHECMEFVNYTRLTKQEDDHHHEQLKGYYPEKNQKKQKLTMLTDGDENYNGYNSKRFTKTEESEFERRQEAERQYGPSM